MKLIVSFILLALALSASAVPREGLSRMIREAKNAQAGPDGPPDDVCGDLITTMQSQKFLDCDNIGFEFTTSDFSYSDSASSGFCSNGCEKLMHDTISQMVTQCNLPSDNADIMKASDPLWVSACYTYNGKHCDDLWLTMMSSEYMQCVSEHSEFWPCPDSCAHVLKKLADELGCCYKSIADVNKNNDPPLYFTDSLWNACKIKEPAPCSS